MLRSSARITTVLFFTAAVAATWGQTKYSLRDLGEFTPTALGNSGVVVGIKSVGGPFSEQPVRWTAEGGLAFLPLPQGFQYNGGYAVALNNSGQSCGYYFRGSSQGISPIGIRWEPSGTYQLLPVGQIQNTQASCISDSGVVGLSYSDGGAGTVLMWPDGLTKSFALSEYGTNLVCNGLNAANRAVGRFFGANGNEVAFRGGRPGQGNIIQAVRLPSDGYDSTSASAINDQDVAVGFGARWRKARALVWQGGRQPLDIGSGAATSVNEHLEVVGDDSEVGVAFIWDPLFGRRDLNLAVITPGFVIKKAVSINDLGQVAVVATDRGGKDHACLLTPQPVYPYKVTDLGDLIPTAINNAGTVAGNVFGDIYYNRPLPFVWRIGSGRTALPTGAFSNAAVTSISETGQCSGTLLTYLYSVGNTACRWSSSGILSAMPTSLGVLGGSIDSAGEMLILSYGSQTPSFRFGDGREIYLPRTNTANLAVDGFQFLPAIPYALGTAMNDGGTVTGWLNASEGGSSGVYPYVWTKGDSSLTILPSPSPGGQTYATGINIRGEVVGVTYGDGIERALLWGVERTPRDLGLGVPYSINANSEAVGGSDGRAIYFGPEIGAVELNAQIADPEWALTQAVDINDAGQIVGQGVFKGKRHGFVLTPDLNASRLVGLGFDTNPAPGFGVMVRAKAISFGSFKSVVLRSAKLPAINMLKQGPRAWTCSLNTNLLKSLGGSASFTAEGIRADGSKSSVSAVLTVVATPTSYPNDILKLTALDKLGTYRVVDGIACDNLGTIPVGPERNRIVIQVPNELSDVTMSDGTLQVSAKNVGSDTNNAGFAKIESIDGRRCIVYYPPDEFNPNQVPTKESDLYPNPTREVELIVSGTRNGQVVAVTPKTILLARPPVMLVHGINSDKDRWRTIVNGDLNAAKSDPRNGFYFASARFPYVAINHGDVLSGNGPVEYGAWKLKRGAREGGYAASINDAIADMWEGKFEQHVPYEYGTERVGRGGTKFVFKKAGFDFDDYKGRRIAARRVDIVAWSYGGMVARWYLRSNGGLESRDWYQEYRPGEQDFAYPLYEPTSYEGDVRKLVTLGTMWRGVPFCNYANEIWLGSRLGDSGFAAAPTLIPENLGTSTLSLGELVKLPEMPVRSNRPSIQVMAVDSPWMRSLIFGSTANPSAESTAKPFLDSVAYGAVAGDDNRYLQLGSWRLPFDLADPYMLMDLVQIPSWFPYFKFEHLGEQAPGPNNWNDGIVPFWSSAIPGSFLPVHSPHDAYPNNPDARAYALSALSSASLPTGIKLNRVWGGIEGSSSIRSMDGSKTWQFGPPKMAPYPQSDIYVQRGGASFGGLAEGSWGFGSPSLHIDLVSTSRNLSGDILVTIKFGARQVLCPGAKLESALLINDQFFGPSMTLLPIDLGTIYVVEDFRTDPRTVTLRFPGNLAPAGRSVVLHLRFSSILPSAPELRPDDLRFNAP